MQRFFNDLSEMNKSVLLSAAMHLILLLIFLLVRSDIDLGSEFAEIGFISASPAAAKRATTAPEKPATQAAAKTSARTETAAQTTVSKPAAPAAQQPKTLPVKPVVDLPKRRMLEDEKPALTTTREKEKLTPDMDANQDIVQKPDARADAVRTEPGEQTAPGPSTPDVADGSATAGDGDGASGGDKGLPFTIEGDAAKRRIISQVLPTYPPDLQREAVVKIRFWVQPDGRIGQMIPVQKGDPQLETITMQAMRQWRFSALSSGDEQKNAQGVITFVYKLK